MHYITTLIDSDFMSKADHQVGDKTASQSEDAYEQYKKERYANYIASRNNLDALAFKTSERYDQWVFTLAGGVLAISLTFIEKIAPQPARYSWILLGLSWLFNIAAILAGFFAIHYSRKAIYEAIDVADKIYDQFIVTSTAKNPGGDPLANLERRYVKFVEYLNSISRYCLCVGTALLCCFALVNLSSFKSKSIERQKDIADHLILSQNTTNVANMNTGKLSPPHVSTNMAGTNTGKP